MKKIELYKRMEACKKVKRSLLTSYMDGYHQSMVLDAQIASITKEMDELAEKKPKTRG
jgi:hypothetical protein